MRDLEESELGSWALGLVWTCQMGTTVTALCNHFLSSVSPYLELKNWTWKYYIFQSPCPSGFSYLYLLGLLAGLLFSSPTLDSQCWGPDKLGNAVAEVSMRNRVCGHSSCDAPEITKPRKTGFGSMVRLTKAITILLPPSEWQFECALWIRGLVDSGGCGLELSVLTDCVLRILIFL